MGSGCCGSNAVNVKTRTNTMNAKGQVITPKVDLKTLALKYHEMPVPGKFAIKPIKAMEN